MCGILAVFCNKIPNQIKQIMDVGKYLQNRGPDSSSMTISKYGIYMFYRLAINDISPQGNQPMNLETVTMMCNGEIYNHKKLREEYDLQCKSNSDCEVILHLYKKFGFVETVKKLDGVFAIVLIDREKVYLARDRIGVRPLFFGLSEEKFLAVASVAKVLTTFCIPIMPFPPGTCVMHKKPMLSSDQPSTNIMEYLYRDIPFIPDIRTNNGFNALRSVLVTAVEKRLLSDRPLGCLLSGGLDSSIVATILSKLCGAKNIRTYSIGLEGSPDLYYSKLMADYLGTNHHEVIFTVEEGLKIIPDVIRDIASYDITTIRASVGMYLLAKYISNHTDDKVIFSGEGADEVFCGYLYFHNAPTPEEGEKESLRLIRQLHLYDVLRADRTISHHGLELRVPFLDRQVVDLALSLPAEAKLPQQGYEKYILRQAFADCIPPQILWRQKCAFSDGVSNIKKSWYQYIQEFVEEKVSEEIFNPKFPSKEAMYYRLIFERFYPVYNVKMDYWMPKWSNVSDPSARFLKICRENEFSEKKI
jgi:asparagine synthase (glutamine-hydrolysing)